ncbi:GNAT family N-acetyltransferase [Photobacterium sp. MCCC 1A19761]|uniref:GNAT family N-acetyltransferase n=1 Tax=Photobacterium sp. MCCC 1A19761 TaxID=3115000 RepID=UPI00307E9AA4
MDTERLRIVPPAMCWVEPTLEAVCAHRDTLSAFLPWVPHHQTIEQATQAMREAIDNFEHQRGELRFFVIRKSDSRLLGAVGLILKDPAVPLCEIGYWLRSDEVGKGYVTEAVARVEQYALEHLNAERLEIIAAATNLRSRAVAERSGYRLEARLEKARRLPAGSLDDTVIYCKHR